MASTSIYELGRLLKEVRRISSPLQRMKLLARGWRSIQRLTPGDRRELAKHVGVEGAGNLIERMAAQKGRVGPALIQRALDKVRESDPEQLGRLLAALRDPRQRVSLIEKGVEKLAGSLGESEEAPPVEEPEPAAKIEQEPERVPEREPAAEPAPQPILEAEPEPLSEARPEPEPKPEPESKIPPEPKREPEPELTPDPKPDPGQQPESDTAIEAATPRADNRLLGKIERTESLTRRFRVLREDVEQALHLDVDQLERLLDSFAQEWARRRVLSTLLQVGVPRDSGQALRLIEKLESPVGRKWCARILLRERTLSVSEREALHGLMQ
jgi:hypothetical protein